MCVIGTGWTSYNVVLEKVTRSQSRTAGNGLGRQNLAAEIRKGNLVEKAR